jgi:hypothetical protein
MSAHKCGVQRFVILSPVSQVELIGVRSTRVESRTAPFAAHEVVDGRASRAPNRSPKCRASRELDAEPAVTRRRSQRARMNTELFSQRVQRKQLGFAPMSIEDVPCAPHECWRHGTAIAVIWAIRLKGHVEECRERSLRVARGRSNVADRWHASHIAIVWRQREADLTTARIRLLFCGHEGS